MTGQTEKLSVAVAGASGYVGAELVRLLSRHPGVVLAALAARRQCGRRPADIFPHLATCRDLPARLTDTRELAGQGHDLVFLALPHGAAAEHVPALLAHSPVIDLSADFRLADPAVHEAWYGWKCTRPDLRRMAVYGQPELNRDAIRTARLVACPGCYPTSVILPLAPLLEARLVRHTDISIASCSGVSGAGREASVARLFCEVNESLAAYGVGNHRHLPEIGQELEKAAGQPTPISFVPHLVPVNRGMLSTIFLRLDGNHTAGELRARLADRYRDAPLVHVLPEGAYPATAHVRGTGHCLIAVFPDHVPGRAVIVSVIDNLVRGAAGQAVQAMNLMSGFPGTMGLEEPSSFP